MEASVQQGHDMGDRVDPGLGKSIRTRDTWILGLAVLAGGVLYALDILSETRGLRSGFAGLIAAIGATTFLVVVRLRWYGIPDGAERRIFLVEAMAVLDIALVLVIGVPPMDRAVAAILLIVAVLVLAAIAVLGLRRTMPGSH